MLAERAGIPSVTVVATSFVSLAHQLAAAEGMPQMRVAVYPGTISIESDAVIEANIRKQTLDQIIEGLTKPLQKATAASSVGTSQDEKV